MCLVIFADSDCSQFPDVENGDVSCTVNEEGIRECSVSCHEGFFRSVPDPETFTCRKSTGVTAWHPAPLEGSICAGMYHGLMSLFISGFL